MNLRQQEHGRKLISLMVNAGMIRCGPAINFDDYLLFEVMLWQGKKGKVFNIWVVCQDIDIYY